MSNAAASSVTKSAQDRRGRNEQLSRRAVNLLGRGLIYLTLAVGVVLFMLPVVWLVGGSLKPVEQVFTVPPTFFSAARPMEQLCRSFG